ncbi:MAG: UDP-N-acetylglucosamine 2-epimerase (non-hydrolyzing), partial [Bacteroidota bacterium]
QEWTPDLVVVVGDVNSTFAAALAANKHKLTIAHLESGLRSLDRGMPEEINRILTDQITELFFVTEQSGWNNLIAEGKREAQLHFVGNTMIDTLVAFDEAIQASPIRQELSIEGKPFVLMTMHRPANVDNLDGLQKMLALIKFICKDGLLVFPIHPRTRHRLETHNLWEELTQIDNLVLGPPMDYLAFQHLIAHCEYVLTDSGGIQEETTFRQVPCLTLRDSTERPSTITLGTNELAVFDLEVLQKQIERIRTGTFKQGQIPPKWDGKATDRIVEVLRRELS